MQKLEYVSEAMKALHKSNLLVSTGLTLQVRAAERTEVDHPQ